ncbi:MAG TPA: hypothetical protein VGJ82_18750 [Thermoanaerobaculia bacterium]|jgi:hypothetical protein
MGTLIITFNGICTHFTKNVPVPHRVVLVNATAALTVSGIPIPPHQPAITFPDGSGPGSQKVTLNGMTISVANPLTNGDPDGSLDGLPNLTSLMSSVQPLSIRSSEYVLDQVPQWSACYFDVNSGTFSTSKDMHGALSAVLTVTTIGVPQLTLAPFPGSTLPQGLSPAMTLGTDPDALVAITISNLAPPAQETESGAHFLLHYLTASQMPSAPQVPQMPTQFNLSVGGDCSNTVYP